MAAPTIKAGSGIQFIQGELASMLSIDPLFAAIIRRNTPPAVEPIQYNIDFNIEIEVIDDKDVIVCSAGNIQGLGDPAINVFRNTFGTSFRDLESETDGVIYIEMPMVELWPYAESTAVGLVDIATVPYNNSLRVSSARFYPVRDSAVFKIAAVFPEPDPEKFRVRVAEYSVDENGFISLRLLKFGSIVIPNAIYLPGSFPGTDLSGATVSFRPV
jgi:hypothetical protein